jgi:hypothetical protein
MTHWLARSYTANPSALFNFKFLNVNSSSALAVVYWPTVASRESQATNHRPQLAGH